MGMNAAEAGSMFLRSVKAGLINADFGKHGPRASTAIAWVTGITPDGLQMLDRWEKPSPTQSNTYYLYGDNYGSNVGTHQNAQINRPTFTIGELDQKIEELGGEDTEALKEMMREIHATLEQQDSLSRGRL